MTNFAACRSKRSFAKTNAIRETHSRATTCAGQSVISGRLPFQSQIANGHHLIQTDRVSVYSGHSSSTLSRASTYQRQVSSASSNSSVEHRCCNSRATDQLSGKHLAHLHGGHQSDQTSVISLKSLIKTQKCGLCKEQINYFREEFICGHAFHGECLWRYEKLNPTYDQNLCPKNCLRRLMIKPTRSIQSSSSSSSSSSISD